jgi:amino acid permease
MAEQPTTPQDTPEPEAEEKKDGRAWYFWPVAGLAVIVAVFLIALVAALLIALLAGPGNAAKWIGIIRDLFIIILAMEGMLMGIALIVLVLQLAALVNLLQNEIQPIVDNANETVSTVRGTAQFMSQNIVEPVVKAGALAAGIGGLLREALGIRRALNRAEKSDDGKK